MLALLDLHGLSAGDFRSVLKRFLGGSAGPSAVTVTRLMVQGQTGHVAFCGRGLSGSDDVHVWADGIGLRLGLEEAKGLPPSSPSSSPPARSPRAL